MTTNNTAKRSHLLPFGGASMKQIMKAAEVAPEPVDPALVAALEWRKSRDARIAAAKAARPVPTANLMGSRYSGGYSAAARSR